MVVQYCSDLHLEFQENKKFLKQFPIEPIGEILLLAGDILPFALHKQPCEFIDFVAVHFYQMKIIHILLHHKFILCADVAPQSATNNVGVFVSDGLVVNEKNILPKFFIQR